MNILGVIPARGGSKGIPGKNLKILADKPLVAHTILASLNSKYINKTVVSTEDNEISKVSIQYGAEVIDRPIELAQDDTKTAPVIVDVVKKVEKIGYSPDIIVLLQPTCPLRDENTIDAVIKTLLESDNDSVFTGFWFSQAMPLWQKLDDGSYKSLYDYHLRPRRQEPHLRGNIFCENGAVYAITRKAFEDTKDFIGNNPLIYAVEPQIDIDTPDDFLRAEQILLSEKSV